MNRRNKFKPALALAAVAIGIIAIATSMTNPIALAGSDADRHGAVNVLPPVGIGFGQTLRVSFLNVGSNPLKVIPCVFDGDGAHLKTGALLMLAPGQMRSFDLSRSEIGGRAESSVEVRAGVHADGPDLKHLVVSGELIEDATQNSTIFVQ
jgi:hypothetical protein